MNVEKPSPPPPPNGYPTWLDYVTSLEWSGPSHVPLYARAELSKLRDDLHFANNLVAELLKEQQGEAGR